MRKRALEIAVALCAVLVGAGILAAFIPLGSSPDHLETEALSEELESTTSTTPPGPTLAEFAAAYELGQFYDAVRLSEFAEAYQSHLNQVAAQQRSARQRAASETAQQPVPRQYVEQPAAVPSGSVWDRLAQCESGGNWAINTGNGFSGGLQFAHSSWSGFGGREFAPMAWQASREQQIVVAERILASQGWRAWPACSARLGLR